MKAYTDIEQSKKLAEFMPLESADMRYGYIAPYEHSDRVYTGGYDTVPYPKDFLKRNPNFSEDEYDGEFPCWSLAALLSVLSFPALRYDIENGEGGWIVSCEKNDKGYLSYYKDNPVDTCYEMVIKLHEQKLL